MPKSKPSETPLVEYIPLLSFEFDLWSAFYYLMQGVRQDYDNSREEIEALRMRIDQLKRDEKEQTLLSRERVRLTLRTLLIVDAKVNLAEEVPIHQHKYWQLFVFEHNTWLI